MTLYWVTHESFRFSFFTAEALQSFLRKVGRL
jgi:hypothetical protein